MVIAILGFFDANLGKIYPWLQCTGNLVPPGMFRVE